MQTNDKNLDANKTSANINSHEISTENANSSQISNANLDNTSHAGQNQILDETSSANLSKIADESLGASSSQSDEFANKNQSATNTSKFGQNLKDRLKLNRPLSLSAKRKLAKDAMTISLGVLVATALMKRTKVVKSVHLISGVLLVGASYYHHTLYPKNYKE